MTTNQLAQVLPFDYDQFLVCNHRLHFQRACVESTDLERLLSEFSLRKRGLQEQGYEDGELWHELSPAMEAIHAKHISVIIFSCMAIEGFLNAYGVRRLTEDFYRINIERLGISEKLAVLVCITSARLILRDHALMCDVRQLFDMRNALVHPKAREVTKANMANFVSHYPDAQDCRRPLDILNHFATFFLSLDSNIRAEIDFPAVSIEEECQ